MAGAREWSTTAVVAVVVTAVVAVVVTAKVAAVAEPSQERTGHVAAVKEAASPAVRGISKGRKEEATPKGVASIRSFDYPDGVYLHSIPTGWRP